MDDAFGIKWVPAGACARAGGYGDDGGSVGPAPRPLETRAAKVHWRAGHPRRAAVGSNWVRFPDFFLCRWKQTVS